MMWAMVVAWAAPCDTPITAEDLTELGDDILVAFASQDPDTIGAAADLQSALLPCVSERLEPLDVAAYYRGQGVAHFIVKDSARSTAELRHAKSLAPTFSFPLSMLEAQHPLRRHYESLQIQRREVAHKGHPQLVVDGRPGAPPPRTGPALLQWLDKEQQVQRTVALHPEEALPDWARAKPRSKRTAALWVGCAASTVLGVSGLAGAAATKSAYKREPTRARYHQNLALGIPGWVLTAGGAGLCVSAFASELPLRSR